MKLPWRKQSEFGLAMQGLERLDGLEGADADNRQRQHVVGKKKERIKS